MADFEGSVNMEGFDDVDETSEETSSENINNSGNESNTEDTVVKTEPTGKEDVVITDKGTKLDPNPQSAVHQELANAKREAEEYRQFMSNPKQLKQYLSELEAELGEKTGESQSEIQDRAEEKDLITDPDLIETPQDLKSYIKFLTKGIEQEKKSLQDERNSIRTEASEKAIGDRLVNEIDSLQAKYSFLNSKSPDFDPELEKEISDQYEEFDFDKRTGKYLGKTSISAIAERAIRIRKLGETTGSKNAQTTVLDKRQGAIRTSGGASSVSDESKMTATQMIASRMARVRGGR